MASNLLSIPNPISPSASPPHPVRRRVRYGKPSTTIRSKQVKPYEDALAYAIANERQLGLTFVFLTVWWGGTVYGGAPDYWPLVTDKMELARKWLWQRGVPFYAFWVREIGETKGEHWHLLVHCPEHLRQGQDNFYAHLRRLIPKSQSGALKIEAKIYLPCEGCGQPRDWKHLARCYFLKGSTDIVRERNGITKCSSAHSGVYAQDQGTIRGKRLGYPRLFAETARERGRTTSPLTSVPVSNST